MEFREQTESLKKENKVRSKTKRTRKCSLLNVCWRSRNGENSSILLWRNPEFTRSFQAKQEEIDCLKMKDETLTSSFQVMQEEFVASQKKKTVNLCLIIDQFGKKTWSLVVVIGLTSCSSKNKKRERSWSKHLRGQTSWNQMLFGDLGHIHTGCQAPCKRQHANNETCCWGIGVFT